MPRDPDAEHLLPHAEPNAHIFRRIIAWTAGPQPPLLQKIRPFFPSLQSLPLRLTHRLLLWQRICALGALLAAWLVIFSLVLHHSSRSGEIAGFGQPEAVWCGATFWKANNQCGLDGNRCRPFDNATMAFRCPASCKTTMVLNPRAVGDQEITYRPFVIGNSSAFRGDSFICQAAIHAGIVQNDAGGCGVARLIGPRSHYAASEQHGIASIAFDSLFPKSFDFVEDLPSSCEQDLRWPLLAVTCFFTVLLSLFTTSPTALFFPIYIIVFFHVALVSNPPFAADYASLLSTALGRFLPATFVAAIVFRFCVIPQHADLTATFERTILWLGPLWVGALNNYTFSNIPLQRLTPHDIRQPGAIASLVIIVLVIFFIALKQAWFLRQEGRFRRYLAIYVGMGIGLLICVAIPQLNLRVHHYFLALLLLPGTRMQNRSSLVYQGLLIGLFINGIARWGFDSIMQTADDLRQDGQLGSLLPSISMPTVGAANITFSLPSLPGDYDGVSVLINDVERHRWYRGEGSPEYTVSRATQRKEYFRFAFMSGSVAGDYTRAGVWEVDGSWTGMPDGPS